MPWRDRRSLDIAGDSQLSRIKTEQAILNLFDRDHLGNRLSVFRDNEFCLSGLHFIHNCQTLGFELSCRDCFQEYHLTMVIVPWSHILKECGNYELAPNSRTGAYPIVHLKTTGLHWIRLGPGAGKAECIRPHGR
jgi:hypothetical protein